MAQVFNQLWEELAEFICQCNSIDMGALNSMLIAIFRDPSKLQPALFAGQVCTFLEAITLHSRNKPSISYSQALSLMSLDSLVYNMYRVIRGNQNFKPNSSSFYGWMSMSHMSAEVSQASNSNTEKDSKKILSLIEALSNSQMLFRKIKVILDRNSNRERSQRYAENLMQTMDYILNKQKCSRQNYLKLRSKHISNSMYPNKKTQTNFRKINQVIFSNQLNKILSLLTNTSDEVHLAMIRIYRSCRQSLERKQFQGAQFIGAEMTYNLHRYYTQSFDEMTDIFEEGKHPLFRFIRNQLLQFVPFFRQFHRLVSRLGQSEDQSNQYLFYKSKQTVLQNEVIELINKMPMQLSQLLNSLYSILQERHKQKQQSVALVKKLLLYSFLLSPLLIEQLMPQQDPSKYNHIYNHVLLLFFRNSTKKLTHLTSNQLAFSCRLIDNIANAIDNKIINPEPPILQNSLNDDHQIPLFCISEPILNHDYELVDEILSKLQFTPKDSKKFNMLKLGQLKMSQSPNYKQFKKQVSSQQINSLELPLDEQIDLITWMSVGGSRQYSKQVVDHRKRSRVSDRLATLPRSKYRQLQIMKSQLWSLL